MCDSCGNADHNNSAIDFFGDLIEEYSGPIPGKKEKPVFVEDCEKCRGTGYWTGSWGRGIRRPCFGCKGTGKVEFKSSRIEREKRQAYAAKIKARQVVTLSEKMAAFEENNPAEIQWLLANASSWEFARSLYEAFRKYGGLTEGQLSAIRKCIQRAVERTAAREIERKQREVAAPSITVEAIERSFEMAKSRGIKRPKLRLGSFKFSLAGSNSVNVGALYVNDLDGSYLGKIKGGRFFRSNECTAEQEAEIIVVASNPAESAVAYGRRTGNCAICGRELTVGESIDRGIGPICAEKYGFI